MPTVTSDQGLVLPVAADANNVPSDLTTLTGGIESRLVKRYANTADRTARNPSPNQGEVCWLIAEARYEFCQTGGGSPVWWELEDLFVNKAAETQVVNNSTALVNDSHLVLPVRANARYQLNGWLLIDSGVTADFQFGWTVPAAASIPKWSVIAVDTALAFGQRMSTTGGVLTVGGAGIGTFVPITFQLVLTTGANAGNLQMQWAPNALEVVNTRVKQDSYLRMRRVG